MVKVLSAVERQNQIIALLVKRGVVPIDDLVDALGVSKMTVHRDLTALEAAQRLRKIHGGATLLEAQIASSDQCYFCHGMIVTDARNKVTLHLADGTHYHACCAHCGLLALKTIGDNAETVLVTDFLSGRTLNAQQATYIIGADLQICCSPTTLAFHTGTDAARFQQGFGGQVGDLQHTLDILLSDMTWHK